MTPVADLSISQKTAFDDGGSLYFAVSGFNQSFREWDIPDGQRGIHRIPLQNLTDKENPDQTIYPDMSRAELFYPLEPDVSLLSMETDACRNNLLLFTEENGQFMLSVIGLDDGKLKQRLPIFANAEDPSEILPVPQVREDYVLVWARYQVTGFLYLRSGEDGDTYSIEGQSSFDGVMPEGYVVYTTADDFDGDRLVIACQPYDDNGRPINSAYLMVFRKSELVYAGLYQNSLDTVYEASRYQSWVWPCGNLEVSIKDR